MHRKLRFGIALLLLLAPYTAHAGLVVKTHNNSNGRYWILRTDNFNHLRARTRNEQLALVRLTRQYGPHSFQRQRAHETKPGAQYSVFPECNGAMKQEPALPDGGDPFVWVDC